MCLQYIKIGMTYSLKCPLLTKLKNNKVSQGIRTRVFGKIREHLNDREGQPADTFSDHSVDTYALYDYI